ncbi:MAG: D-alanine--D-alanine ligase, partial [Dehalococcoidales bacterium]|nr:D-alanine--D-alanine ligase [Dehalococcoidales bacterium]
AGVCTPRWRVVADKQQLRETRWDDFPLPAFLKPAHEGSSKGIRSGSRVESAEQLVATARTMLESYEQPIMVEEFIAGDEITVGVTGNSPSRILGIMRVLPKIKSEYFVYSLEVKRDWQRLVQYECPAQLETAILERITEASLKSFTALGCRDVARVDFRIGREGTPYFMEINPLPGLNPNYSDLCIMAGKMGWTYRSLIATILKAARDRYPQCVSE